MYDLYAYTTTSDLMQLEYRILRDGESDSVMENLSMPLHDTGKKKEQDISALLLC